MYVVGESVKGVYVGKIFEGELLSILPTDDNLWG